MGLFDKIFGKEKTPARDAYQGTFKLLNGYTPVFTSWKGGVYESELIRSAIDTRARHMSKMDVQILGTAKPALKTQLLLAPNPWQSWSQFFYRLSTILDVTNTAMIVPILNDGGEVSGIYTVLPQKVEVVQYAGQPWLRFIFSDGKRAAIELSAVGRMTKFQYSHDLFGDSNRALDPTMELVHIQNQGIEEGVKSAATFRFMATSANWSTDEDLANERARFSSTNFNPKKAGGLILFPNTYRDVKQIDSKPFVADPDQMSMIQKNVYNYFGVNEDVLQNKAYGDSWSAFYEGAVEPFAKQFSEVVTEMLYSPRERQQGAQIIATSDKLQYMSNKDKLEVSAQMADRGLLTINEIRAIWSMPPIEGGNVRPVRGEYYHLDNQGNEVGGENE